MSNIGIYPRTKLTTINDHLYFKKLFCFVIEICISNVYLIL